MNQSPPTETQTGKRIVSKGAYAANVSKKAGVSTYGLVMVLAGIAGIVGAMLMLWVSFPLLIEGQGILACLVLWGVALIIGLDSWVLGKYGWQTIQESRKIETGIPVTHANTADLPAPDSLVRASAEPVQEQQAVLLRAATEAQERQVEQLVRASGETKA